MEEAVEQPLLSLFFPILYWSYVTFSRAKMCCPENSASFSNPSIKTRRATLLSRPPTKGKIKDLKISCSLDLLMIRNSYPSIGLGGRRNRE
jgi:hypothetical protein